MQRKKKKKREKWKKTILLNGYQQILFSIIQQELKKEDWMYKLDIKKTAKETKRKGKTQNP